MLYEFHLQYCDVFWIAGMALDSSGEGNGNPLQYSFLDNPMDRGACCATIHGLSESHMTKILNTSLSRDQRFDLIPLTARHW